MSRPTACRSCGHPMSPQQRREPGKKGHRSRGLCEACWSREWRAGTLERWPRLTDASGQHPRRRDHCARCDQLRALESRGLCSWCYRHESAAGTLEEWPTVLQQRVATLAEDAAFLFEQGLTPAEVADKLNYNPEALGRRLWRHGWQDLGRPLISLGCQQRKAARR